MSAAMPSTTWTWRGSGHHFGLCGGGHALLRGSSDFHRGLVVESGVQSPVVVVGYPVGLENRMQELGEDLQLLSTEARK